VLIDIDVFELLANLLLLRRAIGGLKLVSAGFNMWVRIDVFELLVNLLLIRRAVGGLKLVSAGFNMWVGIDVFELLQIYFSKTGNRRIKVS